MKSESDSRLGLWDSWYETDVGEARMYGESTTARIAGEWLNLPSIKTIEDWGCGHGGFKNYVGPHQTYIGIDGSKSRYATVTADLTQYRSTPDAIHIRPEPVDPFCFNRLLIHAGSVVVPDLLLGRISFRIGR